MQVVKMKEPPNLKVQGNTNKMLIKQYWDLDPQAPIDYLTPEALSKSYKLQPTWRKATG